MGERIEESYRRIECWKQGKEGTLRREVDVPAAVISTVVRVLPIDGPELKTFRLDARALASLEPALRAAQAGP
jgi:hypothetical protein